MSKTKDLNLIPFHDWVRDSRKKLGVTQVELARRMSCTQSSIVRIESGDHNSLLSTLGRVCKALKIDAELFVNTKGQVKVYRLELAEDEADAPKKTGTDG